MKFNVITIFPELISHYVSETILGRAKKNKLIDVNAVDLRDFTEDKHRSVDDTPYGGGAGMVMKPEPIFKALKNLDAIPFSKVDGLTKVKKIFNGSLKNKKKTVLLSPRGKQFDQRMAESWSKLDEITFVCGRYEGIDQRVVDNMVDEEISIGPYVLAGGELGSLIIIETVSRLIPGVLGNEESLSEETFSQRSTINEQRSDLEYPQYTKPSDFKGWKVPEVLLSGDHKKIKEWRSKK
ncbi:tRNA (guanosine(37)-N1)-methyltransferase TrmD [Patescibacteria group bacterium]|nr:tRNA (guanosine(37)-N1)-methyltransferase TrmD [Patescibacteria group bacterium]